MHTALLGLLAETSVHSGSGRSLGVIDLPVSREAITDYPVIPSSSLKGALRDKARQRAFENLDIMFGSPDSAGNLLASDCRLLLLPIRSLTGAMKWACCPYLIERFRRPTARGIDPAFTTHPSVSNAALVYSSDTLILEEGNSRLLGPPEDIIVRSGLLFLTH